MSGELTRLLGKIQRGWDELDVFLAGLTEAQKTTLTDAGGWAIKDHLIHMAIWEDGIDALLNRESRDARMGFDQAAPKPRGVDAINDVIFRQHKGMTLEEVMQARQSIHERFVQTLQGLADDDLSRPLRDFDDTSNSSQPIDGLIVGNTTAHYRKHLGWMRVIAAGE